MPISRDEFESGQVLTKLERAIVSFLERNRKSAFASYEIMDGINLRTDFSDIWKSIVSGLILFGFPSILDNLATKGKIKKNLISGQYYYMAK